jgi:hypothetical protein
MKWEKFNYKNPPESGVYWMAGAYPESDGDTDDSGCQVGWYTGNTIQTVSLVRLEVYEDGIEITPVDEWSTGEWDDDYGAYFYSKPEKPEWPNYEIHTTATSV